MTKQNKSPILDRRRCGVLLHPSSLPGGIGCGDLGPEAFHFIDFIVNCGASVWQVLPLGPTHDDGSPYMSLSVMAGNPHLISLQRLHEWGWLQQDCIPSTAKSKSESNPFHLRRECLRLAYQGFLQHAAAHDQAALTRFITEHAYWLDDYALFIALRNHHQGNTWTQWPAPLRDRETAALQEAKQQLQPEIQQTCFEQFVFFRQWHALRHYANERGVLLFGDMPIFVAHDSAEVWANRKFFDLDDTGQARTIAGVPPDYFAATGQRWGNPHYDWQQMKQDGFGWWVKRLRGALELYDMLRVDHFRGFESYWEIKASEQTAMNGRWVKTPGKALFNTLLETIGQLPFVAEDLGTITPAVDALRERYGWPGMKILQFAFDGHVDNPYLPHNYTNSNCVVYTGTHDNDTTLGWFQQLTSADQQRVLSYLGLERAAQQDPSTTTDMPWPLIRCALASVARLAVLPMQDLLGLGKGHRMNTPGTNKENWSWRFEWNQVDPDMPGRLKEMVSIYGRRL